MRRSRQWKSAMCATGAILLLTTVAAGASASAGPAHGLTTRIVIALLVILGGLETIELLQAVILPMLTRIERKMRRIRKGFYAIWRAIGRIVDLAAPHPASGRGATRRREQKVP